MNQVIQIEPLDRPDTRLTMLISGAPVRDGAGNVIGAVLAQMDITERVMAERAVQASAEEQRTQAQELRRALAVRDTFLRIAAHELRTPLTTLGLRLESLKEIVAGTDDRLLGRVEPAKRQADRLTALVEDLLIVSRIHSGTLRVEPEELDLASLVRAVARRMGPDAERAGCVLHVEAPESVVGRWDREHLEHALSSLLGNAIKYGPHEPIEVELARSNGRVEISVRDRGIGVPGGDQRRIFGPFERAVSADHYGGLGLGLFIARELVRAHGGTLRVESAAGEGAAFTIRLPLVATRRVTAARNTGK